MKEKILEWAKVINENKSVSELETSPLLSDEYLKNEKENLSVAGILDIEATGLNIFIDEISEIAIRKFLYNKKTNEIIKPLDSYNSFNEVSEKHKEKFTLTRDNEKKTKITELTNIYWEDIEGKKIDWDKVSEMLSQCDFIVAHNARFDKNMVDKYVQNNSSKWFCSFRDIDWNSKGHIVLKQEFLCLDYGFVFESHRAINDVDALYSLLFRSNTLSELFEEKYDLVFKGYVSNTFYKDYLSPNRFIFKPDEKVCIRRNLKKSEIDSVKEELEFAVKFINPKANISFEVRNADSSYL